MIALHLRPAAAFALMFVASTASVAGQARADRAPGDRALGDGALGDGATAGRALAQPQFVANCGQWRAPARFLVQAGVVRTWIADDGFYVQAERGELGACVRVQWEGADGCALGGDQLPTLRHWLRSDRGGPVANVPAFARVQHEGLYPNVDLALRLQDGRVEYDLVLSPGAQLASVRALASGHERMRVAADGSLVLDTVLGELRQTPPRTWVTDAAGKRTALPSRFVLLGPDRFGFAVDGWQDALADGARLTIDPGLVWGSFLGGAGIDRCNQVRIDSTGAAVLAGTTDSANLPTTVGAYRTTPIGNDDAFVAKVSADGSALLFCSYLGGTLDDSATALRVLAGDRIAVAGVTASTNFPLTGNRYQPINAGNTDAFATILVADGSSIEYSTYYGGTGFDSDVRLWVTPNEDMWLAGRATGSTPLSPNAYQTIGNGQGDVFFGITNRSIGTKPPLRYGTLFGALGNEIAVHSLHVDGNDIATIGLTTDSAAMVTTPTAFESAITGSTPTGFILCFDPNQAAAANTLVYASYFGATGGDVQNLFVEQDSVGFFAVVVTTSSPNWATSPVSSQQTYGGGSSDGLISRFNPGTAGSAALLIATYLGGSGDDVIEGMHFLYSPGAIDLVSVVGSTTSTNLPLTPSAMQSAPNGGGGSGLCAQLDFRLPGALQRRYSSYFDGCSAGDEVVLAIDRNAATGVLTVAGQSTSALVPGSPFAFQQLPAGNAEGFVARIDPVAPPAAFQTYGVGCGVPGFVPALSAGTPARVCQSFSVGMANLRADGGGFMALGFSDQDWFGVPLPLDMGFINMPGCLLLNSADLIYFTLYTGTSGSFGLQIPGSMQFYGLDLYLQFFMVDAAASPFGLAASNGIAVNIGY